MESSMLELNRVTWAEGTYMRCAYSHSKLSLTKVLYVCTISLCIPPAQSPKTSLTGIYKHIPLAFSRAEREFVHEKYRSTIPVSISHSFANIK